MALLRSGLPKTKQGCASLPAKATPTIFSHRTAKHLLDKRDRFESWKREPGRVECQRKLERVGETELGDDATEQRACVVADYTTHKPDCHVIAPEIALKRADKAAHRGEQCNVAASRRRR